ncbi:unknown protein [Waddlia chondrophila 2032/99]|uniref:Secreted protein n=1 Tax=Waddlia chondrophila 2032/99 TaxID=765953 RepID=F8LE99_9BACT|nr:unknown protein [Waddlia chondrophila 2032/99]
MKEFFKGFAASAAQVGAACVVKWAIVGAVTFACPPAGAAVSSAMTAYSVGMTAYSVGKCAYDNYDTLQEIGDAALAGDLGQIAACLTSSWEAWLLMPCRSQLLWLG